MKTKLTFRISLMLLMLVAAISNAWAQDDKTPPKIDNPNIITGTITHNSISISWNRATDPGGTSQGLLTYQVKYEGTPSKTHGPFTDISSYTINGLNPYTEYKIWVEVSDAAGNKSTYNPINKYTLPLYATGVSISPTGPINLTVGATTTLTATIAPSNATYKTVKWTSSNTAVATVDLSGGVVTAKSAGTATITAETVEEGLKATATVNVTAATDTERPTAPKNVTVSNLSATGLKVTWDASTDNVTTAAKMKYYVEISRFRQVQASATVTGATTHTFSGLSLVPAYEYGIGVKAIDEEGNESTWGTTEFTVPGTVSITGLSLDKTSVNLAVGATESITANVVPLEATNGFGCTWTISDPTVVSMVFNSKSLKQDITGLKTGTATLTVTSPDGSFTATCIVTVKYPTGLTQIDSDKFSAYPNPTSGMITISGLTPGTQFKLYNTIGGLVGTYTAQAEQMTINLSGHAKGMYLIQYDGKTYKIIKK